MYGETREIMRSSFMPLSGTGAVTKACEVHGSRGSLVSADGRNFTLRRLADGFEPPRRRADPGTPAPDTPFYAPEIMPVWHEERFDALRETGEDMDDCYGRLYPALVGSEEYPVTSSEALRVVATTLAVRERSGGDFPLAAGDN